MVAIAAIVQPSLARDGSDKLIDYSREQQKVNLK